MHLQAGNITADYADGCLRYIRIGDREIIRMIYFAIRDQDWKTIPATIKKETIHANNDSFSVDLTSDVQLDSVKFKWKVRISGSADGTIDFKIKGKAFNAFLKNRIGFCVLHATETLAGKPCSIEHPGGYFSHEFFPEDIAPHQPFTNIKALQWLVDGNMTARLDFEGDIFETEDQRNWSDASFKTYSTPLHLPFPVMVRKDDLIAQSVRLHVRADGEVVQPGTGKSLQIKILDVKQRFPSIGLQFPEDLGMLAPYHIKFLSKTGFSHFRTDIDLSLPDWLEKLDYAFRQSQRLKTPLELFLFYENQEHGVLHALAEQLAGNKASVKSVMLTERTSRTTTAGLVDPVILMMQEQLPGVAFGSGTDAHFAELNRNPLCFENQSFVSFSLNPQVHLTDNLTLIENLAAQFDQVKSAKKLFSGFPVHISTVTLKPRFNAVATSGVRQEREFDERQDTEFAAVWTLGSLKYLAEAGAASVTYFETTGLGGIMQGSCIFPVGLLLGFILKWKPVEVQLTECSGPLAVSSLLLRKGLTSCLLLGNHTETEQCVRLPEEIVSPQVTSVVSAFGDFDNSLENNVLRIAPDQILAVTYPSIF